MADEERSGLRTLDAVLLVAAGVVAVLVAFWLLHFIVGLLWLAVKVVVVLAVLGGVAWLLLRRSS